MSCKIGEVDSWLLRDFLAQQAAICAMRCKSNNFLRAARFWAHRIRRMIQKLRFFRSKRDWGERRKVCTLGAYHVSIHGEKRGHFLLFLCNLRQIMSHFGKSSCQNLQFRKNLTAFSQNILCREECAAYFCTSFQEIHAQKSPIHRFLLIWK